MEKVRCNGLAKSRIVPVIWLVFRYWKEKRVLEDKSLRQSIHLVDENPLALS